MPRLSLPPAEGVAGCAMLAPMDGAHPDLDVASAAMSLHVGEPVRLEPARGPRGRHRSAVMRCRVTSASAGVPRTVVVKCAPSEPQGLSPALLNEWAALAFLSALGLDPAVSPAFYGGDLPAGLIVLEDLGDGDGLVHAILGSDPAVAESALLALARALGRMQAASIGRLEEHRRVRAALGRLGGEAVIEAGALAGGFEEALSRAGVSLAGGAAEELERVVARISAPGPFLAFVHGDAGPGNERLRGGNAVLLDFATGGLRHALLDGVCGRLGFPSSWCTRRLLGRISRAMEESYRSELAQGCPAAADDEAFALASATACAYWIVETATVGVARLSSGGSTWGISTMGERLAWRAELLAGLARESGEYHALAETLRGLVDALGVAAERMPPYPAFGGPAPSA